MSAFFANQDVISCEPQDQNDPIQAASAKLMEEVLNYRLTTSIPWFQVCIGGVQDAQVIGVVASYQYWEYETETKKYKSYATDVMTGEEIEVDEEEEIVVKDKPVVELIAIENLRIHPAADWVNPIQSSPYVQRLVPLYAGDVIERMDEDNPKTGEKKWKKYSYEDIQSSQKYLFDTTRLARDDNADRYDTEYQQTPTSQVLKDYDVVWCIENFMRKDGKEYVFWTMGTEFMLTDAKPLKEVYWHGERPIVMGCCVLETNKLYPNGIAALGSQLQKELNENANQRLDNVKLVMNKRYIGRRGSGIDFDSLLRNVAGSVTLADDPVGDVRELEFTDVTSSSYMEQDRLNLDFDELVGSFSQSSVQSNRKLNETVGGMAMLQGTSNAVTEFTLRTISETWIEPVMRQLVLLEQMYETDEVVLALAADRAELWQKFGLDQVTDDMLQAHLTVRVNVGMGATDPHQKLNSFLLGINSFASVISSIPPGMLNIEEVGKEIFGRMGYKDGARFMVNAEKQDPEKMQMQQALQQYQQIVQQLQQQLQDKSADREVKILDTKMKEEGDTQRTAMTEAGDDRRLQAELAASLIEKRMDVSGRVAKERAGDG